VIKAAEQEDGEQEEQQQQAPPPEVIAQQVEAEVMQRPEYAMKTAQARKAEADAMKSELELQIAVAAANAPQPAPMSVEQPMPEPMPDPMEAIRLKVAEKAALTRVDLEAEQYRRKMERDMGVAAEIGLGEEAAEPTEAGPTPVDILAAAIERQGATMQGGLGQLAQAMAAMAQALTAPKRIVRDDKQRVAGVETVN
jgi:hypothetical protein